MLLLAGQYFFTLQKMQVRLTWGLNCPVRDPYLRLQYHIYKHGREYSKRYSIFSSKYFCPFAICALWFLICHTDTAVHMYIYVCVYCISRTPASCSTRCFPTDASFALQGCWGGKEGSMESSHWYPDAGECGLTLGEQPEQLPGREEWLEQLVHAAREWGMKFSFFSWR